jgi:serine/threonine protein kinase
VTPAEAEFHKYNSYMSTRRNTHHPSLCVLKDYEQRIDKDWCSQYYKSHVAIEYHESNLAEDLLSRRRKVPEDPDKYLTEPEIWYVLRTIAEGMSVLQKNGLYHGDIQPRHVLLTEDQTVGRIYLR